MGMWLVVVYGGCCCCCCWSSSGALTQSPEIRRRPKPEPGAPTKSQRNININQMDVQLQHPSGCIVAVLTRATEANPRELAPFRAKGYYGSLEHPVSVSAVTRGFSTPPRGMPEQADSNGCSHGEWSHERRPRHNGTSVWGIPRVVRVKTKQITLATTLINMYCMPVSLFLRMDEGSQTPLLRVSTSAVQYLPKVSCMEQPNSILICPVSGPQVTLFCCSLIGLAVLV